MRTKCNNDRKLFSMTSNKEVARVGKTSYFLALCVDISKTVGDTTKSND